MNTKLVNFRLPTADQFSAAVDIPADLDRVQRGQQTFGWPGSMSPNSTVFVVSLQETAL
jgi:hypothetical protein